MTRVRQWLASPTRPRLFWGRRGFLVRLPGGTYVGRLTGPRDKGRSPRDSKSYLRAAAESCAQTELMFRFVCRAAAQTAERRRRWSTIVGRLSGVQSRTSGLPWRRDRCTSGRSIRPTSCESYRCRQCGGRWNHTEVCLDPARKAWTCRNGHDVRWVFAPPGRQIWTNVERRRYRRIMSMWFLIVALSPSGCS